MVLTLRIKDNIQTELPKITYNLISRNNYSHQQGYVENPISLEV